MTSHHEQIAKFAKTLEEWDYKVDRLEHRVKDLPSELREAAQKKYQKLKDYSAEIKEREEALVASSGQAVHDVEKSIEDVWGTFKLLFEDVEMDVEIEGT